MDDLVAKSRLEEIHDSVSHGALDCEPEGVAEDMMWLCERLREAADDLNSIARFTHSKMPKVSNYAMEAVTRIYQPKEEEDAPSQSGGSGESHPRGGKTT